MTPKQILILCCIESLTGFVGLGLLWWLAGDWRLPLAVFLLMMSNNIARARTARRTDDTELLAFVTAIATISHGKIRAEANKLLAKHGLPIVPLNQ